MSNALASLGSQVRAMPQIIGNMLPAPSLPQRAVEVIKDAFYPNRIVQAMRKDLSDLKATYVNNSAFWLDGFGRQGDANDSVVSVYVKTICSNIIHPLKVVAATLIIVAMTVSKVVLRMFGLVPGLIGALIVAIVSRISQLAICRREEILQPLTPRRVSAIPDSAEPPPLNLLPGESPPVINVVPLLLSSEPVVQQESQAVAGEIQEEALDLEGQDAVSNHSEADDELSDIDMDFAESDGEVGDAAQPDVVDVEEGQGAEEVIVHQAERDIAEQRVEERAPQAEPGLVIDRPVPAGVVLENGAAPRAHVHAGLAQVAAAAARRRLPQANPSLAAIAEEIARDEEVEEAALHQANADILEAARDMHLEEGHEEAQPVPIPEQPIVQGAQGPRVAEVPAASPQAQVPVRPVNEAPPAANAVSPLAILDSVFGGLNRAWNFVFQRVPNPEEDDEVPALAEQQGVQAVAADRGEAERAVNEAAAGNPVPIAADLAPDAHVDAPAPRALEVVVADIAARLQDSAPLVQVMGLYGQIGQPAAPAADLAALVQVQVDANVALIAEARAVNAPADQIEQLEAVNRQLRLEPAQAAAGAQDQAAPAPAHQEEADPIEAPREIEAEAEVASAGDAQAGNPVPVADAQDQAAPAPAQQEAAAIAQAPASGFWGRVDSARNGVRNRWDNLGSWARHFH